MHARQLDLWRRSGYRLQLILTSLRLADFPTLFAILVFGDKSAAGFPLRRCPLTAVNELVVKLCPLKGDMGTMSMNKQVSREGRRNG